MKYFNDIKNKVREHSIIIATGIGLTFGSLIGGFYLNDQINKFDYNQNVSENRKFYEEYQRTQLKSLDEIREHYREAREEYNIETIDKYGFTFGLLPTPDNFTELIIFRHSELDSGIIFEEISKNDDSITLDSIRLRDRESGLIKEYGNSIQEFLGPLRGMSIDGIPDSKINDFNKSVQELLGVENPQYERSHLELLPVHNNNS